MRVEYSSVDGFLSDLEAEKDSIWDRTVRLRIDKGLHADSETHYSVGLWLTAIVKKEQGEFAMELGVYCGTDVEDSDPDRSGTKSAEQWSARVKDTCESLGLKVRPGKYEVY